jgi:hypothetical protein
MMVRAMQTLDYRQPERMRKPRFWLRYLAITCVIGVLHFFLFTAIFDYEANQSDTTPQPAAVWLVEDVVCFPVIALTDQSVSRFYDVTTPMVIINGIIWGIAVALSWHGIQTFKAWATRAKSNYSETRGTTNGPPDSRGNTEIGVSNTSDSMLARNTSAGLPCAASAPSRKRSI